MQKFVCLDLYLERLLLWEKQLSTLIYNTSYVPVLPTLTLIKKIENKHNQGKQAIKNLFIF